MAVKYICLCLHQSSSKGQRLFSHFGTFESDVRVVNMSSFLHARAPAGGQFSTLDEINSPLASAASAPDGLVPNHLRYPWSKLANMLYTIQPQKELKAVGAISVNLGGVATDGALATSFMYPSLLSTLVRFVFSTFVKSLLEAATTAL
ncbi:hypothetical protein BDN71DRAFT_1498381 [Pleurotus eryngii]|uniref:Uncharacterized protein n=1 Tax=Pleurotus eryngii TaxID=5323 RepID=A0A9P5ZNK6_PLEER|nr:hypothetical protein BDN71DRAFT_1498381 [Pleurotus eryngii]